MVALALILLALSALLVLGVVTGDGQSLTIDLFGLDVQTSAAGLFLTGVVVGLVTLLALALLRVGLKQGWRKHQKLRDLERRARTTDSDTGGDVEAGSGVGGGAGDAPTAGDGANETFPDGSTESWPPPDDRPETRPPSGTSAASSGAAGPASDTDQGPDRPADPLR